MHKAQRKYFETYTEPETKALSSLLSHELFDDVVVVPARQESEAFPRLLKSIDLAARKRRVLVILVVNASLQSPPEVSRDNDELLNFFKPLALTPSRNSFVQVFAIDRSRSGLEFQAKDGVGRARKIGCDLAAHLIELGRVSSSFIYCTDADAEVPEAYFDEIPNPSKAAAYVFPFSHIPASEDPQVKLATRIYELFMSYYRHGLEFAGSPFAFYTIGSTLAIRAQSYVEVRGFPIREAGEDFYLLNKLRKCGHIKELSSKSIRLSGRLSDRVPFGTGPSIRRYLTEVRSGRNIEFYDPEVFWSLKSLLDSFAVLNQSRSVDLWQQHLLNDERRGPWILRILEQWKARDEVQNILQRSHSQRLLDHDLMTWFDGFKTLRFIHQLRDYYLPSIPWYEALQSAPFKTSGRSDRGKLAL